MTVWPTPVEDEQLTPLFIHTWGMLLGSVVHATVVLGIPGSTNWGTNNLATFIPFSLPFPYVVRRLFWQNGTAAAGNSDIGLYGVGGTAIFTAGSTALSGNSAPQYVSPANPIVLSPGRYFLAFSHSSTAVNHIFARGTNTTANGRATGMYQQASALPLPATATLAQYADTRVPLAGITRTASGY